MKRILLPAVILLIVLGSLAYFYNKGGDQGEDTKAKITGLLSKKLSVPAGEIQVQVSADTGNFSKGTVNYNNQTGGGVWLAAKTGNGWELVSEGNGIVACEDVDKYNFPTQIVPQCIDTKNQNDLVDRTGSSSPNNASYLIDNKQIQLQNGKAEEQAAPGSSSKISTSLFDSNTDWDINGDGQKDAIVILSQETGGTGIFYYAAVAIKTDGRYTGTNAVLLGDRIAPQTTRFNDGLIEINYSERKPGESFAVRPSVGVTKYLRYADGTITVAAK